MLAALIAVAAVAVAELGALGLLLRRRQPRSDGYPHPPRELGRIKVEFERANERYVRARLAGVESAARERDALAERVVVAGDRMTAVYHAWVRERTAAALAANAGRRAAVVDRLEAEHRLLTRPPL